MQKKIAQKAASMLFLGALAGVMFGGSESAQAQSSDQPCRNSCERSYERCLGRAKNPGAIKKCNDAYEACLATCG